MQTFPISNPANALPTSSPAGGRNDANVSGSSFGQVLSQEVAERSAAPSTAAEKSTGNAHTSATHSTSARPSRQSEGKRVTGDAQDDNAVGSENIDMTAQMAQDILTLVANLAPATKSAQDTKTDPTATDASDLPVAQDMLSATAPALAAAVAMAGTQAAGQVATPVSVAAEAVAGATGKQDLALNAAPDVAAATSSRLNISASTDSTTSAQLPELAAAGPDISSGVTVPASSSSANDFSAIMQESLSMAATMQPGQTAPLAAVNTALQQASSASDKLTPPVGSPGWDQALGQKVMWMVAGEQQTASLTLNPPDLGPLQVVLNVSNSQANATFIAAQPEVRQALEDALPKLRDMLGEAGIQLGQASVNSGSANQQSGTSQQGTQSSSYLDRDGRFSEAPVQVSRIPVTTSGQGLVDTFV